MSILRATATVGGYTMLSRVFGFIRDALLAWALGAGPVSDAFFVAQRLPNLFRTLFAEGAFNAAFVPVFAGKIADEGHNEAKRYAEDALSLLMTALVGTTIVAEAAMPYLIPLLAVGFAANPQQMELTTALTRITFPYLLFISLVSVQGGILNSLNKFAATSATPVLLNFFQIGAMVFGASYGLTLQSKVQLLCWSVTAGGIAQFLWLIYSCSRADMALRLPWPRLTPEMKKLALLIAPGVFGAGVTQINLLVSTNVASWLPSGSISYLTYADRLNQLPLAVVGTAVGTAILPTLVRHLRAGDRVSANITQNRGLELALLLTIPAAVALWVIAEPLLAIMLQRGRFDAVATHATAQALAVYACGLPAFVLVKVLAPAFFARHDTRTPVKIATASLLLNLVLTVGFAFTTNLEHIGNALATTSAGWLNALSLLWFLHSKGHFTIDQRARRTIPMIFLASAGMAFVLIGLKYALGPGLSAAEFSVRAIMLALLIGGGMATYAGLAVMTRIVSFTEFRQILARKAA